MSQTHNTYSKRQQLGVPRQSFFNMKITPFYFASIFVGLLLVGGCEKTPVIETYVISTRVPQEFLPKKQRMLGAFFPRGDQVWFFKVMGPDSAISEVIQPFRTFVETVAFVDNEPLLNDLPANWRRAADKPMRFASISVETPQKQLDISISSLSLQEDWDRQVVANVNRWRGQLNLPSSDAPLAGGESLDVLASEQDGVWVDLIGEPSDSSSAMVPPFASGATAGPAASLSQSTAENKDSQPVAKNDDPRIQFDRPEGWRDGRASSMRLASFVVGPEDSASEMTVIVAGGDLRGNISRWLGQITEGELSDAVIDQAIESAEQLEVDGRKAQRFLLKSQSDSDSQAIDATIVPLGSEQSIFIKMTGPLGTVESQKRQIQDFLKSLRFKF